MVHFAPLCYFRRSAVELDTQLYAKFLILKLDAYDIGGFSWPKGKITMYKFAIEHNTLHFSYAKDLAVSCLFFIMFV